MIRVTAAVFLILALATPAIGAQQPVDETEAWRTLAAALEPAATVAVRIRGGQRIIGTVIEHSNDGLVLKPHTRVPVPARAIPYTDIESIERTKIGWTPGAKVLVGVGIGVGALMLSVLLAFAAYAD